MSTRNLLVELFVEELPPKALKKLGEAFAETLLQELGKDELLEPTSTATRFASPRRLAVHVANVRSQAPAKRVRKKLMPASVAYDANGQRTDALNKRLLKEGYDNFIDGPAASLVREGEGSTEYVYLDSEEGGMSLAFNLDLAIKVAISRLPIPKVMTYQLHENCEQPGWSTVSFVRPAHGLVALHGTDVVNIGALGLIAGRATQGHRFEARENPLLIANADSYEAQMESEGAVMPSFEKRRAEIARQIAAAAAKAGAGVKAVEDEALLDEVTALVERPNVLLGRFDEAFLEVPQECLILTMKANQKYFPLLDASGRLTNRFLIVSNISPADPGAVIGGNERVVRPRLADAKFFFDQDRKKTLASRVEKLASVVYHNKLGSQLERVIRIEKLAGAIAHRLGADVEHAERAGYLAKADLLTDMVGEFPELQGIMGRYYAAHDGEPDAVARAVEQHYWPRFAGDGLPEDNIGAAVALAEKLDTLIGIYGIGLVPSGDKDPFGLRRHALGVLRVLAERQLPLDLPQLLTLAKSRFAPEMLADSVALDVYGFMLERLKNYLRERDFALDEVDAVVSQGPTRIDLVLPRLEAVRAFRRLPEAEALAAANKRIRNILKKTEVPAAGPDIALLQADAEKALFEAVNRLTPRVSSLVGNEDYTDALTTLAGVRAEVDRFFDEVMVMTDEPLIRNNRLALLKALGDLMNQVADISRLAA